MGAVIREIDPWEAGWRKMPPDAECQTSYWLLPTGERYLFPPGQKEKLVVYDQIGSDELKDFTK